MRRWGASQAGARAAGAEEPRAEGSGWQHADWFHPALFAPIAKAVAKWQDYAKAAMAVRRVWPTVCC